MAFKEIFKTKKETLNKSMKWFFGLPIAWTLYIFLSLFIPSFGAVPGSFFYIFAFQEFLLLLCVLCISKFFLQFDIKNFINNNTKINHSFRFAVFFSSFLIGMFSISLSTLFRYLTDKNNFCFVFKYDEFIKTLIPTFLLIIIACITEEIIYRAYLAYFGTEKIPDNKKEMFLKILASGTLFTIAHFRNPEMDKKTAFFSMIFYFTFGVFLMYYFIKTNGIEVPLGLHLANNIFDTYICTYDNAVIEVKSIFIHYNSINYKLIVFAILNLLLYYFLTKKIIIKRNFKNKIYRENV